MVSTQSTPYLYTTGTGREEEEVEELDSDSPLGYEILGVVAVPDRQGRRRSIHNSGQLRKHIGKRLGRVRVAPLGQLDN